VVSNYKLDIVSFRVGGKDKMPDDNGTNSLTNVSQDTIAYSTATVKMPQMMALPWRGQTPSILL
jgi:hypothetical protein